MVAFWWEPSSWLADSCLLVVSSHIGQRKSSVSLLLNQVTNPLMRAPQSWPHLNLITFQSPHFHSLSHCGLEFKKMNFGGYKYLIHTIRESTRIPYIRIQIIKRRGMREINNHHSVNSIVTIFVHRCVLKLVSKHLRRNKICMVSFIYKTNK